MKWIRTSSLAGSLLPAGATTPARMVVECEAPVVGASHSSVICVSHSPVVECEAPTTASYGVARSRLFIALAPSEHALSHVSDEVDPTQFTCRYPPACGFDGTCGVPRSGCWVSHVGCRVSEFGVRVSGVGVRGWGFGVRVLGIGCRLSGFGWRSV